MLSAVVEFSSQNYLIFMFLLLNDLRILRLTLLPEVLIAQAYADQFVSGASAPPELPSILEADSIN